MFVPATLEEVKNGVFGAWLSALVAGGWFSLAAEEHLMMGHTHEDVGQSCAKPVAGVSLVSMLPPSDAYFGLLSKFIREGDDQMRPI